MSAMVSHRESIGAFLGIYRYEEEKTVEQTPDDPRFDRFVALIGAEKFKLLTAKHVVIFGLGGVGSFLTEALARAGVGHLTLFDFDTVAPHNINRQLPALSSTVGKLKVEVMAARCRDINPAAKITVMAEKLTDANVAALIPADAAYVADAIDDVMAKIALIRYCLAQDIPLISAMGTGNKLDPMQLEIADIGDTSVCPLCRAVRRQLRKHGIERGVEVAYSRELPLDTTIEEEGHRVPASSPWVPPSAGLLMASRIVQNLIKV